MSKQGALAAEILEASAAGYASAASAAAEHTLDGKLPEGWGSGEWKSHLVQRILELATAVRIDDPSLFARRINWLRRAVTARGATDADLETALRGLREALQRELPASLLATVEKPIDLALSTFDSEVELEASLIDPATPNGKRVVGYLSACLEGRCEQAKALVLDALDEGVAPAELYSEVLLPAQREIGQLWHIGDVGIGEERLVSETTRSVMSLIVHRHAPPADDDRTVVAAAVAGNTHDIGLRALSDLFQLAGWRAIYLGANVPTLEIAHAAKSFEAALVLLSATLATQIPTLAEATGRVRQIADASKILVGGLALEDSPDLWEELGADAYAPDVESAVDIGTRLITRH